MCDGTPQSRLEAVVEQFALVLEWVLGIQTHLQKCTVRSSRKQMTFYIILWEPYLSWLDLPFTFGFLFTSITIDVVELLVVTQSCRHCTGWSIVQMVMTWSVLVDLVNKCLHCGLTCIERSILPRSKSCALWFNLYLHECVVDYTHKLVIVRVSMVL